MSSKNVRESSEWQALNNIWKACSDEQKASLRSDFQTITLFLKKSSYRLTYQDNHSVEEEEDVDDYYLAPLSAEARTFLYEVIGQGGKNLYHSFMAYLDGKNDIDKDEIFNAYYKKFSVKRPYLCENKDLVWEIYSLCWERYKNK